MATIYRCDRCYFEASTRDRIVRLTMPIIHYGIEQENSYDICKSCRDELVKFLRPLPREEKR